ncbi:LysR family transcriptional regulator [Bradyrhizobium tropiciagri]|uniref:LysR substrate-binding domain-containing protein n=1 Tax=Bradyrhizobium tropiciagri TaxID=312253 RepID=UPI001BAC0AE5|nr:LysR substrate-binding domain-containing protein [Bradyrhizobium tropiciagri]MBR0898984.1 LysR family transcriptional regulator [Bradyrhizobium tropiciagri]
MATRDRLDASLVADLWFFRVAAGASNFTSAADRLGVSQSAVSQRIHRLESRLGISLFVRAERQLKLTYPGQLLFEAAEAGFDGIHDVVRRLNGVNTSDVVKVSCVPSLALEWLTPRLATFLTLHPDHNVAIFAETHDLDRTRMIGEAIDVAIRYGPERSWNASVVFRQTEGIFPVAAPSFIRRVADLTAKNEPVVLLHDTTPWERTTSPIAEWAYWIQARGQPWSMPTRDLHFNLAQLAYRSALEGVGVAMGRALIVGRYLREGRLVRALSDPPIESLGYDVMAQSSKPARHVSTFLAWLQDEMQKDPTKGH